jgi:hypothetical protein
MANTYLTRTPSSAGNRKTFTISAWIKRANISAITTIFSTGVNSTTNGFLAFFLDTDGFLQTYIYESTNKQIKTNARYRDVNGYYHVILAVDTTQATASNRVKFYVNGEQITDLTLVNGGYPSQNFTTEVNNTVEQRVGAYRDSSGTLGSYWNGVISHYHNIDGTAYDPSAFGSTDSTTGEWKINTSPSVTYGTNGFFILKDGNSVTDQSPNTNNFTVAGGTLTKTEDCPSNVFCTMNPLDFGNSGGTSIAVAEKGNTYITSSSSNAWRGIHGTLGIKTGKYYYEVKISASDGDTGYLVGWCDFSYNTDDDPNNGSPNAKMYGRQSLTLYHDTGKTDNFFSSTSSSDILMVAFDMDNGKLWFGKNGTWQNSGGSGGDTTTYSSTTLNTSYPDVTGITVSNNTGFYTPSCQIYNDGYAEFNFGNGYFGTTAVSSAGTNASGNGIFEYNVPTGFTALSTKGLNL